MATGKSYLVEVEGFYRNQTDLAWCIDFGLKEDVWLPKRQVEVYREGPRRCSVIMPEDLAIEKGIDHLVNEGR